MNRSSRGFGLTGVAIAVLVMIVTAIYSASANSAELQQNALSSSVTLTID